MFENVCYSWSEGGELECVLHWIMEKSNNNHRVVTRTNNHNTFFVSPPPAILTLIGALILCFAFHLSHLDVYICWSLCELCSFTIWTIETLNFWLITLLTIHWTSKICFAYPSSNFIHFTNMLLIIISRTSNVYIWKVCRYKCEHKLNTIEKPVNYKAEKKINK